MSKFKVGDKVRRVQNLSTSLNKYFEGEPFVVVTSADTYVVDPEGGNHDCHYLELVTEGPVRTVTRREIAPGTYGHVYVRGEVQGHPLGPVCLVGIGSTTDTIGLTANDLRSAAMILSQIAEALDDKETTK